MMNIPEIETLIDKLSSKKFFMSLVAVYMIYLIDLPIQWMWCKVLGITIIAVAEIYFQSQLDKKSESKQS